MLMNKMRKINPKRIVIKVGTNVLTNENGILDDKIINSIADQIAQIKNNGSKVILITSGAIGAGMSELNLKKPEDIVMKQVCAAVGQSILMSKYREFFKEHNAKIAQILLSYDEFSNKAKLKNLKNSINNLLELHVVPIINENDPVSIDEIGHSFGDNDKLSALVATNMGATLLILLTNVDGLYNKSPENDGAELLKEVSKIDKSIESMAGKTSSLGLGGMKTKIEAAKIATQKGINVIIANGKSENILLKLIRGEEIGTYFI